MKMNNDIKRIDILNVPVDVITMNRALSWCDAIIGDIEATPQAIVAINPEKVIKAGKDAKLLNLLNNAGLLIPDGIGIVIAAAILKLGKMSRVPGSELMPELCRLAEKRQYKIFLYGGSEEVNRRVDKNLRIRYPDIKIVGRANGFIDNPGMPELINQINSSRAQILFLALGSPKQELWMEEHLPRLDCVKICQGVGGTFDVIAGKVKRAPWMFRKVHMEWFYRLVTNPRRLMRQTALPKFAFNVLKEKITR